MLMAVPNIYFDTTMRCNEGGFGGGGGKGAKNRASHPLLRAQALNNGCDHLLQLLLFR
jgi:hypothetical protein